MKHLVFMLKHWRTVCILSNFFYCDLVLLFL